MRKCLRKLLKVPVVLSLVFFALITFVYVKYSNFDGYCEEAGRVLTEEELIKKIAGKIYEENPYCCRLSKRPFFPSGDVEILLNKFFGYISYEVAIYYKREVPLTDNLNDPYYENYIRIDECGNYINKYGMPTSEKYYQAMINVNRKQQKEKKHEK